MEITKQQAIKIAEQFIAANGYTMAAPDRSRFKKESLERRSDIDKILEQRHGTLLPSAYGAKWSGGTWLVAFEYKKKGPGGRKSGRAVRMDSYGQNVTMAHQDARLEAFANEK